MKSRMQEFTAYGLKSRNGIKIDMLFVKTKTNTDPIGKFNCNVQLALRYALNNAF